MIANMLQERLASSSRQNVGPDLDPIEFFEKVKFENKSADNKKSKQSKIKIVVLNYLLGPSIRYITIVT